MTDTKRVLVLSGLAHRNYGPFSLLSFVWNQNQNLQIPTISINLLVVYRESVNLIGYITRRLSADSHQL